MRTADHIIRNIARAAGNGQVINHAATEENPLGQSGIHTLVDDIIECLDANPNDRHRALSKMLLSASD